MECNLRQSDNVDEKEVARAMGALSEWVSWYTYFSLCLFTLGATYSLMIPMVVVLVLLMKTSLTPLIALPVIAIVILFCANMFGLFGSAITYVLARYHGGQFVTLVGDNLNASISVYERLSANLNLPKAAIFVSHFLQRYRLYVYGALLVLVFVLFPALSIYLSGAMVGIQTLVVGIVCLVVSSLLYCVMPFEYSRKQLLHVSCVRNRLLPPSKSAVLVE